MTRDIFARRLPRAAKGLRATLEQKAARFDSDLLIDAPEPSAADLRRELAGKLRDRGGIADLRLALAIKSGGTATSAATASDGDLIRFEDRGRRLLGRRTPQGIVVVREEEPTDLPGLLRSVLGGGHGGIQRVLVRHAFA
jgi:hypothetical protein